MPVQDYYWKGWEMGFGFPLWIAPLFLAFILWSLFWKGLALWHSSRRGQNWWFIVMLVVNTAGILEIAYLFAIIKLKFGKLFNPEHRRSH